ncbi:accessory gene regulator ArgB-like protein [Halanaerobaculum tunisiense]
MSYEETVQELSSYIGQELNLTAKKEDRIRFGIEILISTVISLSFSLILAWLLGIFKPVVFILFTSAILKVVSGGIHLKSVWECASFGAVIINLLGLISLEIKEVVYDHWLLVLVVSSLYIISSLLLWSPAEVAEKPIKDKRHRRKLRLISLVLAILLLTMVFLSFYLYQDRFVLVNVSIILGLLFQAVTINPLAYKLLDFYYQIKAELI